jgi:drug/metabolite transporter (DMT)-like permease
MPQWIFLLVLLAAFTDALQHFLLKSHRDVFAVSLTAAVLGGIVALPVLAFEGFPPTASWPWLAGSIALGSLYWLALGWCYAHGALAMVFPVSRGVAILGTTILASVLLGDVLSRIETMTIIAVIVGLSMVALTSVPERLVWRDIRPSLILAVIITGFTLVDGVGARVSGHPISYCAAIYLGNAVVLAFFSLPRLRTRVRALGLPGLLHAYGIAAISLGTYMAILLAMTKAPIATVAALAETSIVFAAMFGVLVLREQTRPGHAIGVAVVAGGVGMLRFLG